MSGKPICLQLLGYYGNEYDDQISFTYRPTPPDTNAITGIVPWHSHTEFPFNDDDFFWEETYNVFDQIQNNYTFVLHYTGRRWYGEF